MMRSPARMCSRSQPSIRSGLPIASRVSSARLGRAAVQRPGQRADRAHQAGGQVGAGGGDDPGGEGRGVEAVVDGRDQVAARWPGPWPGRAPRRSACRGSSRRTAGRPAARPAPARPSRCSAVSSVGTAAQAASASVRRRRSGSMSYSGRKPAEAPASDSAVRSPASGPDRARGRGRSPGSASRHVRRAGARSARRLAVKRGALGGVGQVAVDHQVPDVLEAAALAPSSTAEYCR